jgi:very-short-patch-repair endonuclease
MSGQLFGIEKLAEDMANDLKAEILSSFYDDAGWSLFGISSPIEKIMAAGIIHCFWGSFKAWNAELLNFLDGDIITDPLKDNIIHFGTQQKLLGGWPVDFAIFYRFQGAVCRLVVECDGHPYHERTKEQAARDRSRDRELQGLGYVIFRFTGSEIVRNPYGCVQQVQDHLTKFRDAIIDKRERNPS